jgi:hypothetical protein
MYWDTSEKDCAEFVAQPTEDYSMSGTIGIPK